MTGLAAYKPSEDEQRDYVEYCVSVLDNPEQLWTHAFAQGLDDHARAALVSLASMPVRCRVADLEQAFDAYCAVARLPRGRGHFGRSLRRLQDSFVRTLDGGKELAVVPLNPSLIDFLRSYLEDHQSEFKRAVAGAAFFEQVVWLWGAESSRRTESIVSDLFDRATQLLQRDPLTREFGIYGLMGRSPSRVDPSTLTLGRLRQMVPWASDAPALTSKIEDLVSTAVAELTEGPFLDSELVRLLRVVGDSPLEAEPLGALIKDRIIAREHKTLPDFDALGDIHAVTPTVFSVETLAGVQEEFEAYVDEVYSDTTAYLQDLNDIEVLESAALGLDVALDEHRMDDVRDAVQTYLEENRDEEEYDREPDFDDDYRPRGGRGFAGEMARVDSLFGRLRDP
ncbi:MAG: hypothetical protein M3P93_03480 [Actinomycetota bacterium]|nr:hypothetical protein [Actinomycetota bacterium]